MVEILKDGLLHPQEKVAGRVVEGVDHLIIIGVTQKVILDEEAKIDIKANPVQAAAGVLDQAASDLCQDEYFIIIFLCGQ